MKKSFLVVFAIAIAFNVFNIYRSSLQTMLKVDGGIIRENILIFS